MALAFTEIYERPDGLPGGGAIPGHPSPELLCALLENQRLQNVFSFFSVETDSYPFFVYNNWLEKSESPLGKGRPRLTRSHRPSALFLPPPPPPLPPVPPQSSESPAGPRVSPSLRFLPPYPGPVTCDIVFTALYGVEASL